MKWIKPQYSRKKVKKSGDYFRKGDLGNSKKIDECFEVLHNWRSSHAFPMQIILTFLRRNAAQVDKNVLVVQRLKREVSILNKLMREKGMSLSRMEDIAGCRAVVGNVSQVRQLYAILKKSSTSNSLHRERNYIDKPKESGYRGIHLIYRYNGNKQKYKGLFVEIQLRSEGVHPTFMELFDNPEPLFP